MWKIIKMIPRELKARFLSKEEQFRYEELFKSFGDKARDSLNLGINGSNLFKVLLLNQNGIKTATLPELETIIENDFEFLKGTYEDTPSVVLRSAGDSNAKNYYLAESLAKLINKRSFSHSVVIEGLNLTEDNNSAYGLSFKKGDKFKVIEAPAFDHSNNGRTFKRINPNYTIDFDNDGTRILHTRDNGLSGIYNMGLIVDSSGECLDNSLDNGRVVVVGA